MYMQHQMIARGWGASNKSSRNRILSRYVKCDDRLWLACCFVDIIRLKSEPYKPIYRIEKQGK
jgi:hypothetical protein